jgi:hypothetical protein
MRLFTRAAVIVLVFAGGLFAGRSWSSGTPAADPAADADREGIPEHAESAASRFLLVLHEGDGFEGLPTQQAVAEYSAWADHLADEGRLAAAEKLTDDAGVWLSGPDARRLRASDDAGAGRTAEAAAGRATGFFIIRAGGEDEAESIASTMPHLRYGGTIQIRGIENLDR